MVLVVLALLAFPGTVGLGEHTRFAHTDEPGADKIVEKAKSEMADLVPPGASPNKCTAVFHWHVEKCAGVTLRRHFIRVHGSERLEHFTQGAIIFHRRNPSRPLVPHNACYPTKGWFSEALHCTWEQLIADLLRTPPVHKRVLVEIGAMSSGTENSIFRIAEDITRVRKAWEARGCSVLMTTLLREPFSHFLSIYNYFIRWKQARDPESYGRTFEDYISSDAVHNFQTRLLLSQGVLKIMPMRERPVRSSRAGGVYGTTEANLELLAPRLGTLLARFDLAAPLERFDEFFYALSERMGLTSILYRKANANTVVMAVRRRRHEIYDKLVKTQGVEAALRALGRKHPPGKMPNGSAITVDSLSPDLIARVHAKLRVDEQLYRHVSAQWDAHVRALPAAVQARMRRYVALSTKLRADEDKQRSVAIHMERIAASSLRSGKLLRRSQ